MKKSKGNILFMILMYLGIYIILTLILGIFNLTFLAWIKDISFIGISLGIIAGLIEIVNNIDKNKKIRKIILYILIIILTFILFIINAFRFLFVANQEAVSEYEGKKMIKETRQVWKSNYIKYYDFTNPFIRSMQERVYMHYDDTISESEYGGTDYYNKNGEKVEDFWGTPFVDFGDLKQYASEKEATYQDLQKFLDEVYKRYEEKIYKVETSDNYLFIYVTNIEEKFATETQKENLKNSIQSFLTVEAAKQNSYYTIRFWDGYIAISNATYLHY